MKDLLMSADPAKDHVWVNGVRDPFISKVKPQSLVSTEGKWAIAWSASRGQGNVSKGETQLASTNELCASRGSEGVLFR